MRGSNQLEVENFIEDQIDSVPQLEALLLIWKTRPKVWSPVETARSLFVSPPEADRILSELVQKGLVNQREGYFCADDPEKDRLMGFVADAYSRDLIRVSRMIHSKGPASVREFAKAFRLKKEPE